MPTRNVVLTEHQAQFVEALVTSGRYQNASEVLRDGLRLVERREQEQVLRFQALREAVAVGLDDIESGRFTSLSSADSLRAHIGEVIARTEDAS
ncbi:type II toxin-antitoxin system ParD family antitoxin [Desulfonatronum parangueonense]